MSKPGGCLRRALEDAGYDRVGGFAIVPGLR